MKSNFIPTRVILLALLIGACAILAYLPALNLGFVNWDDDDYIYQNRNILSLNSRFIQWAFTTFQCGNWHPMTWLSLGMDRFLWGTGPMAFHATNIVLHGLNTALVTILIALLIAAAKNTMHRKGEGGGFSNQGVMMAAAVTGVLFGFHPIHVESVAWVSERKDVLCAFFFLAGILAYLKYVEVRSSEIVQVPFFRGRSSRFYFSTLVLFSLALLSKPMAVTFPVVLLLLDWHPLGRFERERSSAIFMEKLPLCALSFASSIVTMVAQKSSGAISSVSLLPLSHRLLNSAQSFVQYLWKMLVPMDLIPFYPYSRDFSLLSMKYLSVLMVITVLAVSCVVLVKLKKGLFWTTAWGYYLITLLPVLGFIQVGGQSMADRYTYLPSLGPFFLAGLGLALVFERKRQPVQMPSSDRYSFLMVLGVLTLSLTYLTVNQTSIWKNGITLWNYVIEKEPRDGDLAYTNRGLLYLDLNLPDKALNDFDTALTLNPGDVLNYVGRAKAFNLLGDHEKSLASLTTAVTLKPDYVNGYLYLSMIHNGLGDHDKALVDLTNAISIKPDFLLGFYHRGNTYLQMHLYDKAIVDFDYAASLDPDNSYVYVNRGATYSQMKKFDKAIADFNKALLIDPHSPIAQFYRGKAYLKLGNATQATMDFEAACNMGYQESCRLLQSPDLTKRR